MDIISNRNRIARWFRGLVIEGAAAGAPDRLALRHVSVSDRQVDVATFALPGKPSEAFDIDELLGRVEEAIDNDVDGLGGVQKYVLHALREGHAISRLPVRAAASADHEGALEPLESEPANAKGLLGQLMRHNEIQSRMFAMSMGQVIGTMQRTIARLQETAEQSDERRLAAVEITEEMLTRDHERKAMTQMVEDERAVKTAALESLRGVLPFILQFLAKRSGGPGASPILDAVRKFFDSLQPAQFEELSKVLTSEQMEFISQIFHMSGGAPGAPEASQPPSSDGAQAAGGGGK